MRVDEHVKRTCAKYARTHGADALAERFGIARQTVHNAAYKHRKAQGLVKPRGRARPWQPEELERLAAYRRNGGTCNRRHMAGVAAELGRSAAACEVRLAAMVRHGEQGLA